ncbi:MAG: hypothetical protein ATN34_05405 [Epulopiscium sp. Nele67-Bin002]|nr:MAG: hypothetical protein ATN34_05405 [Epulopiscium sp. Nele67-Bin002]
MLQLKNISKQYQMNEFTQQALNNISLNFRDSEFVSILGPSGSGKTTCLNIIGGLDSYDAGDLVINGVSTKHYKDRDWDTYRNHTIGFVFQSYNLIPHQSVLGNVEIALTIGGITSKDRKARARTALEQVGLGQHINKKPNQLSGGQMQRVAIARALVNNPDIILADEPTGALDTETSVQIMELLKEVAKDRLVIMVTHNPELATEYSSRIIRLKDGKVIDDTNPFQTGVQKLAKEATDILGTETSAQIMELLKGVSQDRVVIMVAHNPEVQGEDATRVIQLQDGTTLDNSNPEYTRVIPSAKPQKKAKMSLKTSVSLSFNNLKTKKKRTLLTAFSGSIGIIGIAMILSLSNGVNTYIDDLQKDTMTTYPVVLEKETFDLSSIQSTANSIKDLMDVERNAVYSNHSVLSMSSSLEVSNNLEKFKVYLDNPESEINDYVGSNGIIYSYNVSFNAFAHDSDGNLINTSTDSSAILTPSSTLSSISPMQEMMSTAFITGASSANGAVNFSQIMTTSNGPLISPVMTDNYDVLYGHWPENYDEVVLVLDYVNSIDTTVLYQLGFLTAEELIAIDDKIRDGQDVKELQWNYKDTIGKEFSIVLESDRYELNPNGTYSYIEDERLEELADDGVKLEIVGVVKPNNVESDRLIATPIAYSAQFTDYIAQAADKSDVIVAQEADPQINVLTGTYFEVLDDEQKVQTARDYILNMSMEDKVSMYQLMMYLSGDMQATAMDDITMATMMNSWAQSSTDYDTLIMIYDNYVGGYSYNSNLATFGKIDYDNPDIISIYIDNFEDKELLSACIEEYNEMVDEDSQITYTDLIGTMISSMTSMIDIISYVLIAFVGVSLIVSSIMIGIITHISVIERTKEIGVLRALGASKKNISQVFKAETLIIGLCSGLIGVGTTVLMNIPITNIIQSLVNNDDVKAHLPLEAAIILIILSVAITVAGGLLPANSASKKDPVIALRSE